MKVTTQRLPESQVLLEIEVDPEQMERSLDRAYQRLVQKYEVPGFRKGKTPRNMLERHIGRGRHGARGDRHPDARRRTTRRSKTRTSTPSSQPDIELVKDEPLSFKATVAIRPDVDLGDYQSLRVEREPVKDDGKDLEAALEDLRKTLRAT